MKYTTYSEPENKPRYRKGDDWSERVANGVAKRLGIPAACTELAVDRNSEEPRYGVISKSVRDGGYTPEAYVDRAKSPFAGRPHPITVAMQAIEISETRVGEFWINQCEQEEVDNLAEPIRMIPGDRMSGLSRQFVERVLRRNCHRLFDEVSSYR